MPTNFPLHILFDTSHQLIQLEFKAKKKRNQLIFRCQTKQNKIKSPFFRLLTHFSQPNNNFYVVFKEKVKKLKFLSFTIIIPISIEINKFLVSLDDLSGIFLSHLYKYSSF